MALGSRQTREPHCLQISRPSLPSAPASDQGENLFCLGCIVIRMIEYAVNRAHETLTRWPFQNRHRTNALWTGQFARGELGLLANCLLREWWEF